MPSNILTKNEKNAVLMRIISDILEGNQLKVAVKNAGISLTSFNTWLSGDREAAVAYSRARELCADVLVDEAKEIADTEPDASKARNQIDIRKWIASKHHSRVYGDRVDVNVSQTIDISTTLQEAKARLLRPVRDQLGVSDAQVIDMPRLIPTGARDTQSVDRPKGDEVPDIFD